MIMMNEEIKRQVYNVLEKYNKHYNKTSVNENLLSWQLNKGWLVDLLRCHPNWNEEALAAVFEVAHSREIDKSTVNLHKYELGKLITELDIAECE